MSHLTPYTPYSAKKYRLAECFFVTWILVGVEKKSQRQMSERSEFPPSPSPPPTGKVEVEVFIISPSEDCFLQKNI